MKYMRKEMPLFVVGSIALLGGSVGELVNPIYIGMFVDNLNEKKYDRVYTLCW
jgi:ABC-type multidrug transport system fused ATPase/permease subunit